MDSCLETVPLESFQTILVENQYQPNSQCWGRLLPLSSFFTIKDLDKDEVTFGRGDENDVQFIYENSNAYFQSYSKFHFTITRVFDDSESFTYLNDLSGNGTFINGVKVGKGKKQILNNNDEISLCHVKNKVFLFMDPNSKNDLNLPDNLNNKYILSKTIGRGSYGEVKLAFERESNKKYAIKIILKKIFGNATTNTANKTLMNEVKIMKSLSHPCIIGIKDVYDSDEALFIVMELVGGGELFEKVIANGSINETETKLIFYQIFSGVKYLHDMGISHRDLKPENILLTSDAKECLIKVTDFGISKFIDDNTMLKTLCGTPTYLAPEILKSAGMGQYTKEVDCWSLGVVLFICLAGFPPFSEDRKDMALNEQILTANYQHYLEEDLWKNISENAKDLLVKLLKVDPIDRISSNSALEHAWFEDNDMRRIANELMFPTENFKRKEIETDSDPPVKRSHTE